MNGKKILKLGNEQQFRCHSQDSKHFLLIMPNVLKLIIFGFFYQTGHELLEMRVLSCFNSKKTGINTFVQFNNNLQY